MKLNSGVWLEKHGRRYSLHTFRWGFHAKRRHGLIWNHLAVKLYRGSVFGQTKARHQLWIGWWTAAHGQRGRLSGWRFVIAADRLPAAPRDTIEIPFFPQGDPLNKRQRRRAA